MMDKAARLKDSGERNDLEAGMAKYLASEYCAQVVQDAFRIQGGCGYSRSTRSSGSTAKPRCCSSARAPPTSNG
jgi:alkylation response protein AidB-like acyl-CoA dehydrogenase